MPAELWCNLQDGELGPADLAGLVPYVGVLLICGWRPPAATLAELERAGRPVRLWRFCQDPRAWPGWPDAYVRRCAQAVFWNEPDIEGAPPAWSTDAAAHWFARGGQVGEGAWSDEEARRPMAQDEAFGFVTAHVYPRGRGAANLAAVRRRADGRPVLVTEFGIAFEQRRCLVELAALGVTEPAALFIYPRWAGDRNRHGYDLAGVGFDPIPAGTGPESTQDGPGGPIAPKEEHVDRHRLRDPN